MSISLAQVSADQSEELARFYLQNSAGIPELAAHLSGLAQIQQSVKSGAFAAWVDDQVRALLLIQDVGEAIEIHLTATDLHWRRRGLMQSLLAWYLNQILDRPVWLEVQEQNEPAKMLYRSLGFVEVGRRRNYYGPGVDALLMNWSAQTVG